MPTQKTQVLKKVLDGRVRLERRNDNPMIYARAYMQGKDVQFRTGQTIPHLAEEDAVHWYLSLRERVRKGESLHGRKFSDVADAFIKHADTTLRGEISDGQIEQYSIKWAVLKKHLEHVKVTDITTAFLVKLRVTRTQEKTQRGTFVKPTTIQKDLQFIRLVLKYARDVDKSLKEVPEFPSFRGERFTVVDTATPFLTLAQYNRLYTKAKERMKEADLPPRARRQREELACYIAICVGAALRVGEAASVRWQDCRIVRMNDDKQEALHMRVRGKHAVQQGPGVREDAYGFYHAVDAYRFLKLHRPDAKPEDMLFLENHRDALNALLSLEDINLRVAENGALRNAKSFRHTGISMRIEYTENPNLTDVAKWARTSVTQIEHFYDQNHPQTAAARIAKFRKPKGKAKQEEPDAELQEEDDDSDDL